MLLQLLTGVGFRVSGLRVSERFSRILVKAVAQETAKVDPDELPCLGSLRPPELYSEVQGTYNPNHKCVCVYFLSPQVL